METSSQVQYPNLVNVEPIPLTDAYKEIALKELRETEDIKLIAIEELKNLLKEEKDFLVPLDDTDWLVRFLRPCKFYPESARDLVKRYYLFKHKYRKSYDGLIPRKEFKTFQSNTVCVLPRRDQYGRRILIINLTDSWPYKEVPLENILNSLVIIVEGALLEPETQVCGGIVILDVNNFSLTQATKFTPDIANRLMTWLQYSMPFRFKNVHIVNETKLFSIAFAVLKRFFGEKIRPRIIFHGKDHSSLHKYISPECLPTKYGGTQSDDWLDGSQLYKALNLYETNYETINRYGYKNK